MGTEGVRMSFCLADDIAAFLPPPGVLAGQEFEVPWDDGLVPARIETARRDGDGLTLTMVIEAPFPELREGLRLDLTHPFAPADD